MATIEEEIVEEKRNVTPQQLGIIVGALVLVLLLVYLFVLRGGGEEEPVVTAPIPGASVEPTPADLPGDGAGNGGGKGPVETFEVFAPRDPFKPLVSEDNSGGGGGTGDGGDGNGGGTGDGGDGNGGTGLDPGGTGGQNVDGHSVRLIDVIRDGGGVQAQIQVDQTVYTVDEGETFASNFQLLSVSGECASLLFGDDQFTLCEGEEILK